MLFHNGKAKRLDTPVVCIGCNVEYFPWAHAVSQFCSRKCWGEYRKRSAVERFWKYVDKSGPVPESAPQLGNCWIWTGCKINGYGQFPYSGGKLAYRFALEIVGAMAVPAGFEPDHLCRTRACVRPDHFELVTHKINTLRGTGPSAANARKTHCLHGHEFTKENTLLESYRGSLHRRCLTCRPVRRGAA